MKIVHQIVFAVAVLLLADLAVCSQLTSTQFEAACGSLRSQIAAALAGKKVPGISAAVALSDGRLCHAAAGTTANSTDKKLAVDDPILAGSIGKTFVSALALQLVEEGKLKLDEPINKYLGDRPWFKRIPNSSDITVRMLMNHSSGVPNHVDADAFFSTARKSAEHDVPFDYLLSFIFDKKPLFAAGRGYAYGDTNYILLAMIEEKIAGESMYAGVSRRFLVPLKLENTTPSNKSVDPVVHGFYENKPVVQNGRLFINPQWEWAGGGFYSTPTDLARWAIALYGGKVLKGSSFDQLIGSTTVGDGKTYGLGVEITTTPWGPAYGHDGEWPGYLSLMRYYPKASVAVALQINASGTPEAYAFQALADDMAGLFIEPGLQEKVSPDQKVAFEKRALQWLALVDAGKLPESWDGLFSELKNKYSRSSWPKAIKPLLAQAGTLKNRRLRSVMLLEAGKVNIDFDSSFTKAPTVRETITFKLETDGEWRVSSYSIHG
jgi:D-alanyl-D-alanine carboxypeptidase